MAENEAERHKTKVAVAKNRYSGATGPALELMYDRLTGRMHEIKEEIL
jgi:hypothetical protein